MAAFEAPDGPLNGSGRCAVQVLIWRIRPRFPQSRKECVHYGQRAENVHFEFASDGVEWERLDRSGSQDSGVTDEKIDAAICLRAHGTSPALDSWLVGDIATGQCHCAAGGLLQVTDFLWCDSRSKDAIALCSETKRNISPEPTTRTS